MFMHAFQIYNYHRVMVSKGKGMIDRVCHTKRRKRQMPRVRQGKPDSKGNKIKFLMSYMRSLAKDKEAANWGKWILSIREAAGGTTLGERIHQIKKESLPLQKGASAEEKLRGASNQGEEGKVGVGEEGKDSILLPKEC